MSLLFWSMKLEHQAHALIAQKQPSNVSQSSELSFQFNFHVELWYYADSSYDFIIFVSKLGNSHSRQHESLNLPRVQ